MKYEYQVIVATMGIDALIAKLNVAGATGWDVIQIQYKNEGLLGTYIAFMKKASEA